MEPSPFGAPDPPREEPVQPHDLGAPAADHPGGYTVPSAWTPATPQQPQQPPQQQRTGKRALGPIAAAGAALAKWGAILLKLKALTLFGSVAISIAAYTAVFGFTFALAFAALLLVHEMGHFIYFAARGLKPQLPVFIPFLGAYTKAQKAPTSVFDEALSGLAGPALGMVAAGVAGWRGHDTHSTFLYAVAFIGFFLNLFNLVPLLPLDGGHVAVALHPAVSALGLALLLVFELRHPSVFILIFIVLGAYMTWQRYKQRDSAGAQAYHALTSQQRLAVAALYIALVAIGLWGESYFYVQRTF